MLSRQFDTGTGTGYLFVLDGNLRNLSMWIVIEEVDVDRIA